MQRFMHLSASANQHHRCFSSLLTPCRLLQTLADSCRLLALQRHCQQLCHWHFEEVNSLIILRLIIPRAKLLLFLSLFLFSLLLLIPSPSSLLPNLFTLAFHQIILDNFTHREKQTTKEPSLYLLGCVLDIMEDDIAVVGIGLRFPGEASSPDELWKVLERGESQWSEFPKDRLNIDGYYHPGGDRQGSVS
jgi:hypothetical protein